MSAIQNPELTDIEVVENAITSAINMAKFTKHGFIPNNKSECKLTYLLMIHNVAQQAKMFTQNQKDKIINVYHKLMYNV